MSTHRSRLLLRLTAFVAAGALTAGGLAFAASPASAAEETIDNATFTWGVSGYAQDGIFGPWTFKDFSGDATYLEGNVVTNPVNTNPQTEYLVDPVPATSFPTSKTGKSPNAVKLTGGDGTVDRVTGAADLAWEGSYTINAYPAQYNAPNEIYKDPNLTVEADGSGELTAEFTIGAGADMEGNPFPAQDFGRLKIATFDAGSLSAKSIRGYRVTPDFQGVTNGIEGQNTSCTAPNVWGSWPTDYIDALNSHTSGQSVLPHFYTTGCGGKNDNKPALPFDIGFPTTHGEVEISQSAFNPDGTQSVTVTGAGFDPDYAAGNAQPPFAGKSSGVYIAFGRFQDVWDPAAGAASSTRALADDTANRNGVSVKWAVPASSFPGAPAQDPNAPSFTQLNADGSFSTTLQIDKSWISASSGNWGIYTYRGGNPGVTEYATYTPISFLTGSTASLSESTSKHGVVGSTTVTVASDGEGTPTGNVTLTGAGAAQSKPVGDDGKVAFSLPKDLAVGSHSLTATYEGDDDTAGSESETTHVVTKGTASVAAISSTTKPTTRKTGSTILKVKGAGLKATGKVRVVLTRAGRTTYSTTGTLSAAGSVRVKLPKLPRAGTWSYVVRYYGDASYVQSDSTKRSIVIKTK